MWQWLLPCCLHLNAGSDSMSSSDWSGSADDLESDGDDYAVGVCSYAPDAKKLTVASYGDEHAGMLICTFLDELVRSLRARFTCLLPGAQKPHVILFELAVAGTH